MRLLNNLEKIDNIKIFDTTLRDGEQTPGVTLTPEEKVVIAKQLDKLGVDTIEAGFPITSKGEMEGIKLVVDEKLNSEICGLARLEKEDIDAVLDCGPKIIHLFIATSDIHLKYKLKIGRDEALKKITWAIDYAKSNGLTVEFSAEDATRSDLDYLLQAFKTAVQAGADRLDIPDTVGAIAPNNMRNIVAKVKDIVNIPISVHCHDDFGLAVANSIAGIEGGAERVHVCVNGLGERAGNASLEEIVMALQCLHGLKTNINTKLIYKTSRLVSRLMGVTVQPNKAIVGDNAFGHESGIHTHGVLSNPLTYEPLEPELVGRKRWIQAGKHAGGHGIHSQLEALGLDVTKDEIREIVSKVKDIADKGKFLTDSDLDAIARNVMGQTNKEKKIVNLEDLTVVTGIKGVPTASVRLLINKKEYVASETGVGPVDSAIKAIQKITDDLVSIRLKDYRLEAITGGTDALGEVMVRVEDDSGNMASASAAREDIVVASVEAMVDAINKILIKKEQGSKIGSTAL